jgi:hypothetical protein
MKGNSNMELKRISKHDINIRHTVNGGMVVNVGCAVLSFSSPEDMIDAMKQYYDNPDEMERKYYATSGPIAEATDTEPGTYAEDAQCENRPHPHGGRRGTIGGSGSAGNTLAARSPRESAETEESPDIRR